MYYNIITFFIAVIIQGFASQKAEAVWTVGQAAQFLAFPVLSWAALRFYFQRLTAGALHDGERAKALQASLLNVVAASQNWLLLPFAILHFSTPYPTLVVNGLAGDSELFSSLLGIGPFILFLVILWWESYPLHCLLMGRSSSRLEFIASYARMELPILVPWIMVLGITDVLDVQSLIESYPMLSIPYSALFFILLGVFMPLLARIMWKCKRLPEGPLRTRIVNLCDSLDVSVRDVLDWPLLGGSLMNAGIMGLAKRFRYLLVTPALAEVLTPDELDGVIAHEAGHAKYNHFSFYLIVFFGFACLTMTFLPLAAMLAYVLEATLPGSFSFLANESVLQAIMAVGLVVILILYFRVFFGAVSRAFERQADGFVLESMGRADNIISALERISYSAGDLREAPSWHHGSIADRVDFLAGAAKNPRLLKAHNALVSRIKWGLCIGLVFAAASAATVSSTAFSQTVFKFVAGWQTVDRSEHMFRVKVDQYEIDKLLTLADRLQGSKKLVEAERVYLEILNIKPDQPMALNNLAWIYATSEDPALFKPERALPLAETAVKLSPEPYVLDTYAEALFRTRNVEAALAVIKTAIAMKPANPKHYFLQMKKFQDALESSPKINR